MKRRKKLYQIYHIPSAKTVNIEIPNTDKLTSILYKVYYDNEWDFPPTLEQMRKEVDIDPLFLS